MTCSVASILKSVTPTALRQLAAACRESRELSEIPSHVLEQIVGSHRLPETLSALRSMNANGWSSDQIAYLVGQIAEAAEGVIQQDSLYELVLSGPDVIGVNVRDTLAVVNELFVRARKEVILVGYAVHNGQVLFQRLAERLSDTPDLKIRMYLDISRRQGDTSLSDEIVRRFTRDFFGRQWPWDKRPELYYDVRSLEQSAQSRSSLHAKCVIIDRATALITSANFTSAALERNIEAGILMDHVASVATLVDYLEGLCAAGTVRKVPIDSRGSGIDRRSVTD